jgi:hypothetical protein
MAVPTFKKVTKIRFYNSSSTSSFVDDFKFQIPVIHFLIVFSLLAIWGMVHRLGLNLTKIKEKYRN